MNIADIRAKFPTYNDLSDDELVGALHRRYYSDIDIDVFRERVGLAPAAAPVSPVPADAPGLPPMPKEATGPGGFDPAQTAMISAPDPTKLQRPDVMGDHMTFGMMGGSNGTEDWAVREARRQAAAEGVAAPAVAPQAPSFTPTPPTYTPTGEAILSELGNVPERVQRGLVGNTLAGAESQIIASMDNIGAAKSVPDQLPLIQAQKAEIQKRFEAAAAAGSDERFALAEQFAQLDEQERRLIALVQSGEIPAMVDASLERNRAAIADAQRTRNEAQDKIGTLEAAMTPVNPAPGLSAALVSGIASMGDMAPGLVTTLATKNPLPMLAYLGAYSRGSSYVDKRAAGYDSKKALVAADLYAAAEAIPEMLPLHVILKEGLGPLSKIAGGALTEGASEVMTQGLQQLVDMGVLDENMTWQQAAAEMAQSGTAGAVMGGLMGGGGAIADSLRDTVASRAAKRGTPADPNAFAPQAAPKGQDPILAAMAPDAAPVIPQPEQAGPQMVPPSAPVMPGPEAAPSISPEPAQAAPAAAPAPAPTGAKRKSITPEEVAANPGNFDILDESDSSGGEWRLTGNKVALDKTTGQIIPIVSSPTAQAEGAPGGAGAAGTEPQVEPVPVDGPVPVPPAAAAPEVSPPPQPVAQDTPTPQEAPATPKSPAEPAAPLPARIVKNDTIQTPAGRSLNVDVAIVSADDLVASNLDDGRVNPAYPQDRQPRDRTKDASERQIQRIMRDFNPRLLDHLPTTADGGPVIDPAGIVESGNGRTMMLRRIFRERPDLAKAYQDNLRAEGYQIDGIRNPVLVRIRRTEMTPAEIEAYTRESNTDTKLAMTATEQAMADRDALPDSALDLFRGGDIDAAGNRDFVRAFMQAVVPENEQGKMVNQKTGEMSQDAVRRLQGALLAKAYGDAALVAKLIEAADTNIKAIGGALLDVSPSWAKMRAAATAQRIAPEMDQTDALLEAVRLVDRARSAGRNVIEFVKQPDLLNGEGISPMGQRFLALMFRDVRQWTKPAGRDRMVTGLQFYVDEAMKTAPGADMFGTSADPQKTLDLAKGKQDADQPDPTAQTDLFAPAKTPAGDGDRVRPPGGDGAGSGEPVAAGQGSEQRPQGSGEKPVGPATGYAARSADMRRQRLQKAPNLGPTPGTQSLLVGSTREMATALEAKLDAAATDAERRDIADAFVLEQGRKTGREFFVAFDGEGLLLEVARGGKSNILFTDIIMAAIADGDIGYTTHNHPSNRGPSYNDIRALALKMGPMKIMGHGGAIHTMTLTDAGAALPDGVLAKAFTEIEGQTVRSLQALVNRDAISADIGNQQLHNIATVVLQRLGLINLAGTAESDLIAQGIDPDEYVRDVHASVAPILGRGGYSLPPLRDRGGDPGARADGAKPGTGRGTEAPASDAASGDGKGRNPAQDLIEITPPPSKATRPEKPAKVAAGTGNSALDGALDDIFGDQTDVPGTGTDLERDRGDGPTADGMGGTDVPAAAGGSATGAGPRGGAPDRNSGQRGGSGGVLDGNAAPVGGAGNPDVVAGKRPQPGGVPDRDGGGRDAPGDRGLRPDGTGTSGDPETAPGGTGLKRTDAEKVQQIRDLFSEGLRRFLKRDGFAEEATGLDPRKVEALDSIFAEGMEGLDPATMTDRELFRAIILPLVKAGLDRPRVAALTPYLEDYLARVRTGRVIARAAPVAANSEADRTELPRTADRIKPVMADEANIRATLPLLLPEQQDDVLKVERRFAKADGHGMMITNGTGTGKTFSGGGVVKRFVQMGKRDVLILAPSEAVIQGWTRALEALGVPVHQLTGTKDAGQGVTITTYANISDNTAIATRSFDLIVPDEAQNLSSNQEGNPTGALQAVRALAGRPQNLWQRSQMLHADDWAKYKAMKDGEAKTAAYDRMKAREKAEVERWATEPRGKVLFLSATPFAYDQNIEYAEGFLFSYPEDGHIGRSRQSGRSIFFTQNFGYRIRYHKLTKPEAAVDSAVFEREFHEKLKRDGALTGRSLQIDVDYDRRFVVTADEVGTKIDEVLRTIWDGSSHTDKALADGYQKLAREVGRKFNYLKRMQLLEAIKAKASVPDIEAHLAMGRKVVVFHDYNIGGGFNPFADLGTSSTQAENGLANEADASQDANWKKALDDLRAKHPDLAKLDFSGYAAPATTLRNAFGKRARIFSGAVSQKERIAGLTEFNKDGSGIDVLVVQADAGGAGISMHDVTGQHQRVLINLGMPTKPTTTLQEEGRILRVGTRTNAAFRYYTIGTSWEKSAFAQRIAERSGTVENLALGNQARAITQSFIEAYMDAEPLAPSADDGTGGKAKDRSAALATPFDIAKTHYFGRAKVSGRRDQRAGVDFYATPEPLGLMMVRWAGIRPNERVLEPSAGDGAVARYVPDYADLTMVEPSMDLGGTAQLRAPAARMVPGTFESYHISNKHHVILMNPPFGSGGATAMAHLSKAATRHLRPGGRIVALIPTGPAADKRWNAWWESDEAKGLALRAEVILPAVAFERAGTSVMTRVLVIDKPHAAGADLGAPVTINLSGATDIKTFFDRLEQYDVPARPQMVQKPEDEIEAEGQDATEPARIPTQSPPLSQAAGDFKLSQVKHGKTGEDLFVATAGERVEREDYLAMLATAKKHGGWYSSFKGNGAVPGFQFKTEAGRTAFVEDMTKPRAGVAEADPVIMRMSRDPEGEGLLVEAVSAFRTDVDGNPLILGHLHVPDDAVRHNKTWSIGDIYVSTAERRRGIASQMVAFAASQIGGNPIGATSVFSADGAAFFDAIKSQPTLDAAQAYQRVPPRLVRESRAAAEEILRQAPALRAELDRLDLGRVRLFVDQKANWQGKFAVMADGAMEITIGASLDPMKTLHHEVIHALKVMNLFTPSEWTALELAATKGWLEKHDIAARYPDLSPDARIEEAIAEEFAASLEARRAPKGSALVHAFNKIARFFRAVRNVFNGAGFQTAEDVFGRVLAGQITQRQAGPVARPMTAQQRAHRASAMGGGTFIPDRHVWEELRRAGVPIWDRLRNARGGARDAIDRARVAIQDRFLPVLRAQEAVMRETGAVLPDSLNAYAAETTYSGKVGRHLFEIDEGYTKPIIDLISDTRGDLSVDDVGTWLYARHAIERNARIAEINPEMPDGGSGMMTEEAQLILDTAASSPHAERLKTIGDLVDRLRERTLALRENAGLITHDEAKMWRTMYRHYVPLKGFAETDHSEATLDVTGIGRRFSVRGPESKRALGRQSEAFNPLQATITQAQEVAIRAEKNRVGQSLHELASEFPSKQMWSVKKPKQKRYYNRTTGLVETRIEDPRSMILEPNEMAVKVAGEEVRIIFHDERLAAAAAGVGADQMGTFLRFIAPLSRWYSMARTMLNPEFVITNAVRDFESAQINVLGLNSDKKLAIAKAMARDWRKAFMGALRGQSGKANSEWTKHYQDFQRAGAQVSFWTIEAPEAGRADLERRINLKRGNKALRALKRLTVPSMRDNVLLSNIERVNLAVDNAIRLAAFVQARKEGMTTQEAAFLSKELTVNFNRRGEYGPVLNTVYPFFNAATQGTVRLLQAMRNPKLLVGLTIGGIGLGLIMDLVNASLSDEDDDGELLYDKIPDFRSRRNLHLVAGGDGSDAWAVPLAYGYNIFPYAGQQLGKIVRGVKSPEAALADVGATFLQAYLPTDSLVPGLIEPAFEIATNENYFGNSIYPSDFYGNNEYLPDASKYFPSATGMSVEIAKTLNEATGGNEVTSGLIDLSPEVIDHVSSFVVGSAGAFWGRSFDSLGKVLNGQADKVETGAIPFVRVVRSSVSTWADKDRFRAFGVEVQDAQHDVLHWPAGSPVPSDLAAKAKLYDLYLQAKREMDGKGEFNANSKKFARLPRDERSVIMEFNREFLKIAGKRAE